MEDLAHKYTRALDQIKRQRTEVEELLKEARALEASNAQLKQENSDVRRRNLELERHAAALVSRNGDLEKQARELQQRVQRYIDAETDAALKRSRKTVDPDAASPAAPLAHPAIAFSAAATPPHPEAAPSPSPRREAMIADLQDEIVALQHKVRSLETASASATSAAEKFRRGADILEQRLTAKADELAEAQRTSESEREDFVAELQGQKAKESALLKVIEQLRSHQLSTAAEVSRIEEVEAKALEGVRAEWLGAVAECERLARVAEDARTEAEDARAEHSRVVEQLEAQRTFINENNELTSKEMRALRLENDILLRDLKTAVDERDQARVAAAKHADLARRAAEANAALTVVQHVKGVIGAVTYERGVQAVPVEIPALSTAAGPSSSAITDASRGAAAAAVVPDVSALVELEAAVAEWRGIAESARDELQRQREAVSAARARDAAERDHATATWRSKAEALAERLHSALAENEALCAQVAAASVAVEAARSAREERSPSAQRHASRGAVNGTRHGRRESSALERLASADAEDTGRDLDDAESFIAAALQLTDDAMNAAVQAHYMATTPMSVEITRQELEQAATQRPVVPCQRYRLPAFNELHARLGGLRHLAKAVRSELWTLRRQATSASHGRQHQQTTTGALARSFSQGSLLDSATAARSAVFEPRGRDADSTRFAPTAIPATSTTAQHHSPEDRSRVSRAIVDVASGRPASVGHSHADEGLQAENHQSRPHSNTYRHPAAAGISPLAAAAEQDDGTDDVEALLARSAATIAQLQWGTARIASLDATIDSLRADRATAGRR
jgi:hypothetical protein